MNIHAIILAAGQGTRMQSSKPKVLQMLAGKSLLAHVLDKARQIATQIHVVYGVGGDKVRENVNDNSINWVHQPQQLGTGDAVAAALKHIADDEICVILYGDVPLIEVKTLQDLVQKAADTDLSLLSVKMDNPRGYGRIIRNQGKIISIIEQQDASPSQLKISEVNSGIMASGAHLLKNYLHNLNSDNAGAELYLTDIVKLAVDDDKTVSSILTSHPFAAMGVNDKAQLAVLERAFQQNQAQNFMQQGLSLKDPKRFDCRAELSFGKDCEIDINVLFEGKISLGNNTTISPNCRLKDAKIGDNVSILSNCVIENSTISNAAKIGPFAHIRPQSEIGEHVKIGNFVEVKKSTIGKNSKISHLSYIGDSLIGENVNIGAGVITCNYDGTHKHQTHIGDNAFIGSNSQLIAPVSIGANAFIAAGSTISKNAPANQLTLSRGKQISLKNWKKPN